MGTQLGRGKLPGLKPLTSRMRLVVIHHDLTDISRRDRYWVHSMTPHWQARGIEVVHAAGTRALLPADAALVHVDMSVVPRRFIEAASRYPVVFNTRVTDIRKSRLPGRTHVVRNAKAPTGPVLAKTDFNCAAIPERELWKNGTRGLPLRERWHLYRFGRKSLEVNYALHGDASELPASIWKDPRYVVERFLPEREGAHFVLRWAFFLGSAAVGLIGRGANPVVRASETVRPVEPMSEIHPEVLRYREEIGLDYGKIDYVLHEGRPVILDVNKTIGGTTSRNPQLEHLAATLAAGLILPTR